MKHLLCILLSLLFPICVIANERNLLTTGRSETQVASVLQSGTEWVRYPAYTDRAGWEALLGARKEELIRRGEKRLNYKWQYNLATDYLEYNRSGNRTIQEAKQTANANAISDLVLAELAEGKGRFIDQIINGVWLECERTSWVLSAHLFRQPDGTCLPNDNTPIVDLGAGETGGLMAWTWYFFHSAMDSVNPSISIRLKDELHRRITVPFMTRDNEWWLALHLKTGQLVNNWNPWCNFNCLQVIMLTETDKNLRAEATWRSMQSVDRFLNYVKADGACEEGPSYWGHAAGKLFDYLDLLYQVTGGRVDIFSNPQISAMGEYIMHSYVGDGWVVNFADASARYTDNLSPLMYCYAKAIGNKDFEAFAAMLAKDRDWLVNGGTDMYRSLESLRVYEELTASTPALKKTPAVWYPETQFCYFSAGDWFLATKGGNNNESHNHNDVGTCIVYWKNAPVLIDAGVGTYTGKTFSSERYDIWTMQSGWHNLPVINGVEQHNGADFRCTSAVCDAKKERITYEISAAYPESAGVSSWKRNYQCTKKGITITDAFAFEKVPEAPNELHFLVQLQPRIEEGKIHILTDAGLVTLDYDKKIFSASIEAKTLDDPRLSKVWGKQIYRITLKANNTLCRKYVITLH